MQESLIAAVRIAAAMAVALALILAAVAMFGRRALGLAAARPSEADLGPKRAPSAGAANALLPGSLDALAQTLRTQCDALIARNDDLQRSVEALRNERGAAQAENRAKSEYLAYLGHEIRTPVGGMLGLAELLLGTQLDPAQRRYANLLQESGTDLLRLTTSLLDYAKAEAGKLRLEHVDFDLKAVVERVTRAFSGRAEAKRIGLSSHFADDLPLRVRADATRLQQVLANLVSNAVKFTHRGEVRVEVERSNAPARREPGGADVCWIRIRVVDTGIGMCVQGETQLFQPFAQCERTIEPRYDGSGLGLAISKRLVELMGGTIGVASEPGQGSVFWIDLPLAPAPASATVRIGAHGSGRDRRIGVAADQGWAHVCD